MLETGNINLDRSSAGRNTRNVPMKASCCVLETVEISRPIPRPAISKRRLAVKGMEEGAPQRHIEPEDRGHENHFPHAADPERKRLSGGEFPGRDWADLELLKGSDFTLPDDRERSGSVVDEPRAVAMGAQSSQRRGSICPRCKFRRPDPGWPSG